NENTDKANLKTMQGKVARVSVVAGEAQTVVSFLLEDEKTIFSVTTNNSPLALFLKEGDQVTFKAVVTENAKAANVEELKIAGLN
ncbi:DNA-binding protein, partial [Listeria monocytogenes]|nr:DNA-binding protein [Listeria monocytogenes]